MTEPMPRCHPDAGLPPRHRLHQRAAGRVISDQVGEAQAFGHIRPLQPQDHPCRRVEIPNPPGSVCGDHRIQPGLQGRVQPRPRQPPVAVKPGDGDQHQPNYQQADRDPGPRRLAPRDEVTTRQTRCENPSGTGQNQACLKGRQKAKDVGLRQSGCP